MTSEEFFMYLTIGLIVLVPISVRVYRYLTVAHMKRALHEQLGRVDSGATESKREA